MKRVGTGQEERTGDHPRAGRRTKARRQWAAEASWATATQEPRRTRRPGASPAAKPGPRPTRHPGGPAPAAPGGPAPAPWASSPGSLRSPPPPPPRRPRPLPARAAVTSRPRREGRHPAHITSSAPPAGAYRLTDGGPRAQGGVSVGCSDRGLRDPRPMAGPAPPAADELPGPARRLYSRSAGRSGTGDGHGNGDGNGDGWRGAGGGGGPEQRQRQARNVAGCALPGGRWG